MKISSVSKKVLASALSAAMVVAFAPTVAFGAVTAGAKVKVAIDLDNGTYTGAVADVKASVDAVASDANTIAAGLNLGFDASKLSKSGAGFDYWWYDADGNGKVADAEKVNQTAGETVTAGAITLPASVNEGDTITLKAVYKVPAVSFTHAAIAQPTKNAGVTLFSAKIANATDDQKYQLSVTKDGQALTTTASVAAAGNEAAFNIVTTDVANLDGKDGLVLASKYTAGKYTFTVTNLNTGASASKDLTIDKVTLDVPAGTKLTTATMATVIFAEDGQAFDATTNATATATTVTRAEDNAVSAGWEFADGTTATAKLAGDTTLTPVFAVDTRVATVAVANDYSTLDFAFSGLKDSAKVKDYTVKIAGPGVDLTLEGLAKDASGNGLKGKLAFSKDATTTSGKWGAENATTAGAFSTSEKIQGGTYTVTLIQNNADKTTTEIGSKSAKLAAITYDLGEGYYNADSKLNAEAIAAKPSVVKIGGTFANAKGYDTDVATTLGTPALKDGSTNAFTGWTIDGKALTAATVIDGDVVVKANYAVAKLAAPTFTYDAAAKTLTFAAAEGDVWYSKDSGASWTKGNSVSADPAMVATVQVKAAVVNGRASDAITLYSCETDAAAATTTSAKVDVAAVLKDLGNIKTVNEKDYVGNNAAFKAAVADINASIVSKGYDTVDGWKAAILDATKSGLDAFAAYVESELDVLKAGVTNADGSVTKLSDGAYTSIVKDIETSVSDFVAVNDGDTKTDPTVEARKAGWTYTQAANYMIGTSYAAAKKAATTYTKADVDAAAAVTAQLKDPATAAAGLEAYKALTDAQKQLVASADLAAAEEAVAAAELKVAQDDAAVSKARSASKTVKAGKNGKTTKKQSVTLKKITSKSGAKVTYKKSSGSSKVSVKSGKAYLAKGVKKGTYKATVKATCGTQTAKITVKFVVK